MKKLWWKCLTRSKGVHCVIRWTWILTLLPVVGEPGVLMMVVVTEGSAAESPTRATADIDPQLLVVSSVIAYFNLHCWLPSVLGSPSPLFWSIECKLRAHELRKLDWPLRDDEKNGRTRAFIFDPSESHGTLHAREIWIAGRPGNLKHIYILFYFLWCCRWSRTWKDAHLTIMIFLITSHEYKLKFFEFDCQSRTMMIIIFPINFQ